MQVEGFICASVGVCFTESSQEDTNSWKKTDEEGKKPGESLEKPAFQPTPCVAPGLKPTTSQRPHGSIATVPQTRPHLLGLSPAISALRMGENPERKAAYSTMPSRCETML